MECEDPGHPLSITYASSEAHRAPFLCHQVHGSVVKEAVDCLLRFG